MPKHIKNNHWCPYCYGNIQKTIKDMQEIAAEKGGKCFSTEYINNRIKLEWQCSEGHIFWMNYGKIQQGAWCPKCGKKRTGDALRDTIENMHALARQYNGKCLSTVYYKNNIKLEWQCEYGHKWSAVPASIKNGTWCPYCAGFHKTIKDMRKLAAQRNGWCLSEEYINAKTKLLWQCEKGHQWMARPTRIQQGTWCPICSQGKSERAARKAIENIYKVKFPSSWPSFLNGLQLDCYNEELGLALEYQGQQHFELVDYFHNDEGVFKEQIKRDKRKKKLCDKHGVTLIYLTYKDKTKDFESVIMGKCSKCGY